MAPWLGWPKRPDITTLCVWLSSEGKIFHLSQNVADRAPLMLSIFIMVLLGPTAEESKDALMLTNMYRAMHQAPEVTWNKEMTAQAQDWADKLAREQRLVHENESSADYGENLAEIGSDNKALLRAIDAWYNEVILYNFKEPKFSTDTGHFSQVRYLRI